ncbi:MAG: molecular chaperone HtpG [Bacteroidota bacterium]|nr:molecular chaperone HtpG [Bacteroidota bacterium]
MSKGTLSVHTENIFPIIKKFLYSDHEIFLRELVANATDATQKVKTIATNGSYSCELGELNISIIIDADAKTLTISDKGIGLTEEEVEKYINQIAFSGAEEWLEKYKDDDNKGNIIGHFGLGFYSAFMVADKVEIQSLSYQPDAKPVHWECIGTTTYEMNEGSRTERGTDIILHINPDSEEFLEESRIKSILDKYNKFMPFPILFGEDTINETEPLWLKKPNELTEEEYKAFYQKLYPFAGDPLFWIHLNVDYPFNLTGILYFPKINNTLEVQKNKIQLYSNQVFVTDEVKEIVPEFLTLLHGVIDSPDIPLNVSRSYLQADGNVKKISAYIVKKVAEKLADLFNDDRQKFEEKWPDIGFFIKYGMLTDDKFSEKAMNFSLIRNINNDFKTLEEYKEQTKALQTDKTEKLVWLYAGDDQKSGSFSIAATERGYDVALFDQTIDNHWMQHLESKLENTTFKRVDSETIDKLIDKGDTAELILTDEEKVELESLFKVAMGDEAIVKIESMNRTDVPVQIVQNEFMRRFKEMSRMNGQEGIFGGNMGLELAVNGNHPTMRKLLDNTDMAKDTVKYLVDLAKLNQNLLTGKDLHQFVVNSFDRA